ncbi:sensor histidine kinase [Actinomycetaceae bacterium WB03_NA08]|uniref:histidine kinase n=1 Tax=Scrofimicrobium canadense TaxID=2652290 RepID=A0A6N7W6T6_9ACTO|nr:sensor histidine kinase [Scrofimicrobium canadense]MSS84203.1 sensor histidine kinase [Scrofimicrobium canadense]
MVAIVGIATYFSDWMQMFLFVCYPLTWILSRSQWQGLAWTWLLTVSVGLGLYSASGKNFSEVLGYSVVVGAFSSAMGLWISAIFHWGQEREEMRHAIEASRDRELEAARTLAIREQHEHMAREVHDTLAQGFVSVIALSQAAQPLTESVLTDSTTEKIRDRLDQIEEVARENLEEARALIQAWKPPSLAEGDLKAAVERLVTSATKRSDITFNLTIRGDEALSTEDEVTVLRILQELTSNVTRHSQANTVTIEVCIATGSCIMTVEDDGIGIAGNPEGTGLQGVRQRARISGGHTTIESPDNGGTRVRVVLPREAP